MNNMKRAINKIADYDPTDSGYSPFSSPVDDYYKPEPSRRKPVESPWSYDPVTASPYTGRGSSFQNEVDISYNPFDSEPPRKSRKTTEYPDPIADDDEEYGIIANNDDDSGKDLDRDLDEAIEEKVDDLEGDEENGFYG